MPAWKYFCFLDLHCSMLSRAFRVSILAHLCLASLFLSRSLFPLAALSAAAQPAHNLNTAQHHEPLPSAHPAEAAAAAAAAVAAATAAAAAGVAPTGAAAVAAAAQVCHTMGLSEIKSQNNYVAFQSIRQIHGENKLWKHCVCSLSSIYLPHHVLTPSLSLCTLPLCSLSLSLCVFSAREQARADRVLRPAHAAHDAAAARVDCPQSGV